MAVIRHSASIIFFFSAFIMMLASGQQISTACTNALLRSFTPCLNYLTGSSNGGSGGSPTSECCKSLSSLISSSTQCACLVFAGNVPLSLPINRTLAFSLPRLCHNTKVPLQCSPDVGTPLPGPGPVSYAPSLPPLPPQLPPQLPPPVPPQPTDPSVGANMPPPSVPASPSLSPPVITSPPFIPDTPSDQGGVLLLPNKSLKINTAHVTPLMVVSMVAIFCLY